MGIDPYTRAMVRLRPPLASDLLAVKLMPPTVSPGHRPRPELLARLDQAVDGPLTLVRAPAGYGKSSLVAAWAVAQAAPIAWVSLDDDDNDPTRFWRYLLTACRAFGGDVAKAALADLTGPAAPPIETVLTAFLNDLQALTSTHVLVLDDVQALTEPGLLHQLSWLLAHQPSSLRLVLIARQEPALGLARWRAHGDLTEIGEPELRLTELEVARLLESAGRDASAAHVAELLAATRGWPAAVRLLTLHPVRQGVAFVDNPALLSDYVAEQVLDVLAPDVRDMLLRTCLLPAVTGDLSDTVTGRDDGAAMLAELERQGLFLESFGGPAGRRWFRFHRLFGEALRVRADVELGAGVIKAVWAASGAWYERMGQPELAVDAFLTGDQPERAARVLDQILATAAQIDGRRLAEWETRLPESVLRDHPRLTFELAHMRLYLNDRYSPATTAPVEERLRLAEAAWSAANDRTGLGRVTLLRASLAFWQGDPARAVALAQQGLPLLAPDDLNWRGIALSYIGGDACLAGRPLEALPILLEGATLCDIAGNRYAQYGVLDFIGMVALQQAEPLQAEHHFRRLLSLAEEDERYLDDQAHARLGLAQVHLERNELALADDELAAAQAIAERLSEPRIDLQATLLSADLAQAQGRSALARSRLDALAARTRWPNDLRTVRLAQALLAWRMDDIVAVRRWQAGLRLLAPSSSAGLAEREELLALRLRAVDGDNTLAALDRLLEAARDAGRVASQLSILVVRAAALSRLQPEAAPVALADALLLAQPRGLRRVFLDEGRPIARLLQTTLPRLTDKAAAAFAGGLVRAFPAAMVDTLVMEGVPLAEPLSPQERRVLRLLAAGLPNAEIARELVVSPNTIKTQLQSLYRKLTVGNRHDAISAARELDLL